MPSVFLRDENSSTSVQFTVIFQEKRCDDESVRGNQITKTPSYIAYDCRKVV